MEAQGLLARELSRRSFGGQCFFCNSGAEAIETAIKLSRLHGKPGRYKIVTMFNGFHGRTMGAVSATAQPKYHQGFEPMLPGFQYVPFGDLDAAAKAIDNETAAILVESIQGEGGINISPAGYLAGLRELADKHKLLFIIDEVQAGMGRTGKWFGYQHWGIEPDVITLAKALGGGVAVGGIVARKEIADKLKPGMHASTFGGNPIACRAALATIETIDKDGLLERAEQIGERFRSRLEALKSRCPWIKEIRVKGAMIGIELSIDGVPLVTKCLERRLLVNCTHNTIIRLLPALNLSNEQLDEGCAILEEVLATHAAK
jgi:acetylornithine/succinyldiaminopimelate/putrescine aminotransferase